MQERFRSGDFGDRKDAGQFDGITRLLVHIQMVGTKTGLIGPIGQGRKTAQSRNTDGLAEMNAAMVFGDGQKVHRRVGKHPRGGGIIGHAVDVRCWAELRHPAVVQGGGIAAQQQCLFGFGGGVDKDRTGRLKNFRNFGAQFFAQFIVKVCKRLVQQHQPRAFDQRACQGAALLLAARQFQRFALQHGRQFQHIGGGSHGAVNFGLRDTQKAHRGCDVVIDGHRRVVDELLVNHRHLAVLHPHARHIGAIPKNAARGGRIKTRHQPHQAGFARRSWPQKHVHRAFFQRQIGWVNMGSPFHQSRYAFEFQRHIRSLFRRRGNRGPWG